MKMGDYYSETEDDFLDAHEVFVNMSDSGSECEDSCSISGFGYDSWIGNLDSVDERRNRFMRSMGLSSKKLVKDEENDQENNGFYQDSDEVKENPEPVSQQDLDIEDGFLVRQPSLSCWSNMDIELRSSGSLKENLEDRSIKKSFDFNTDMITDFMSKFRSLSQRSSSRKETENVSLLDRRKKGKTGWLQKLHIKARTTTTTDHQAESSNSNSIGGARTRAVHVHTNKKKSKELSSVYTTQDFPAHNGSISVLKFSHDGRYLASAGDDCIVRIWEISEHDQDPTSYEIQENDPSKRYFSTNHLSELAPIKVDKEKTRKITRKSSEVACVILPPKVFRILETPVHEFRGHGGEILSLAWSTKGYLLSSSIDKTVRMWKVGHDECLKVYPHNNYVTCVEFNPMDENHFISGSIDGKVRIWEVRRCKVVDWIDIREIVTAVCYYTNGKGCIVGTLDGNCSFYDIIDKQLHLDTHVSAMSKKKWPRRITGFQFCPTDSRKVIVSSADSQVRVLCGVNVVGKFKGNRSSGSQLSASFTSDGKHIVSTGDDSNIYIWNHISSDKLYTKAKSNFSCESFFSENTSVAVTWRGIKSIAAAFPSPRATNNNDALSRRSTINSPRIPSVPRRSTINSPRIPSVPRRSTIKSPRIPSLNVNRSFLMRSPPTYPAETLPDATQVSVSPSMRKSEYKFLRSAYRSTFVAPHTWGLVIIAAGLDGRIRTYVNYGLPVRL